MKNFEDYPEATQATVNQAIHDYFEGIKMSPVTMERLTALVENWQPETERSERATK